MTTPLDRRRYDARNEYARWFVWGACLIVAIVAVRWLA